MLTLTMGYKKPQNPDTGDVFFPALENNIQQLNDHAHNGVNSQLLASTSQTVQSASWAAAPIAGGVYRQLITAPTGYSIDQCEMWFKLSSGETVYPAIERQSSTTYYIYTNDNSKTYTAFYR